MVKIFSKWYFLAGFVVIHTFPHKRYLNAIQGILEALNSVLLKVIGAYVLKPQHLTESSRENRIFVYNFLTALGINQTTSENTAKIFSCFIEYDNAYRYRLQDLFTATSKEKLIQKEHG